MPKRDRISEHNKYTFTQVDKTKFKIGTLDQLMELNETLVKVDQTLETTAKRMEKLASEITKQELFVQIPPREGKDKQSCKLIRDRIISSTLIRNPLYLYLNLQICVVSPYDYLKNFQWDQTKFHYGRSLVELAGLITDRMKSIDRDVKEHQDRLGELRSELALIDKKDGTNFLTQDIREPIYRAQVDKDLFVETYNSAMFTSLIAVVHKARVQQFLQQYEQVIPWNDND